MNLLRRTSALAKVMAPFSAILRDDHLCLRVLLGDIPHRQSRAIPAKMGGEFVRELTFGGFGKHAINSLRDAYDFDRGTDRRRFRPI